MTDAAPEAKPKRKRPRRTRPRKKTVAPKKLTRERLRDGWAELDLHTPEERDELFADRPRTWGECREMPPGPCPYVGCSHHNYLDVNPETGSITLNFPDLEPWEIPHPCSLRVTESGSKTLEQTGEILNLTRERIRQIEVRAIVRKAKPTALLLGLNEVEIGKVRNSALASLVDQGDVDGVSPSDVKRVGV